MASERLDIRVSETGARVVKKNIADIGVASQATSSALGLLRNALLTVGAALSVRQLAAYADQYTQVINRLKLATSSTAELARVESRLFAVSQETRTSLSANAQLYGRLSIAAKELGADQNTLLEFTRGVGLALAVSGQSAEQASGALLQLSQAVGAGIVRAEEFNSILEGAPRIAQAVADGLDRAGGSVAKLRKEVINGTLSSKEFFDALMTQIPVLEQEFARTMPTIGQAFQLLENQLVRSVGQIDQQLGLSGSFAQSLTDFAKLIDRLTPTFITLGRNIQQFGEDTGNALRMLGFNMDNLDLERDLRSWVDAWDNFAAGSRTAMQVVITGVERMREFFSSGEITTPPADIEAIFSGFLSQGVGAQIDAQKSGSSERGRRGIGAGPLLIPTTPGGGGGTGTGETEKERLGRLKREADELLRVQASISSVTAAKQTLAEAEAVLSREQIKGNVTMQEMLNILSTMRAQLADQLDPMAAINRELEAQEQNFGKSAAQIEVDNQVRTIQQQLLRQGVELGAEEVQQLESRIGLILANQQVQEAVNQQKQADIELTNQLNGAADEYADTLETLNRLLADGMINTTQFQDAQKQALVAFLDTQRDFASGISRGLLKMEEEFGDFASVAENALRGAFDGASDAIVEFAQTGKVEVGAMLDQILEDLLRFSLRAAAFGFLQSILSNIGSSFGGGGYANPTSAQLGTIGQPGSAPGYGFHTGRGPGEFGSLRYLTAAMVDMAPRLHSGRLGPHEMAAVIRKDESVLTPGQMKAMGGRGGKTTVQIFENSSNTRVSQDKEEDELGNETIRVFIDDLNADNTRRRGSRTNSVLRQTFNMKQRLNTR